MFKVLMLNPLVNVLGPIQGLKATSWDPASFWMEEDFAFSRVFELSKGLEVSPYLLVDARLSFLLSLLNPALKTSLIGLPPLAALMFQLRSSQRVLSSADFSKHWSEYSLEAMPEEKTGPVQQSLMLNDSAPHGEKTFLASFEKMPVGKSLREWKFEKDSELGPLYLIELSQ